MKYARLTTGNDHYVHSSLSTGEVAKIIADLRLRVCKVQQFEAGWSAELEGEQIFRATALGNERYHVRIDQRVFPDV